MGTSRESGRMRAPDVPSGRSRKLGGYTLGLSLRLLPHLSTLLSGTSWTSMPVTIAICNRSVSWESSKFWISAGARLTTAAVWRLSGRRAWVG
jgi:hypothetical protein